MRAVHDLPSAIEAFVPPDVANAFAVRLRLNELNAILTGEEPLRSEAGDPRRSPSPTPTYDNAGMRTNTREIRKRTNLLRERQICVDNAFKLSPGFRPPADFKQIQLKITSKIYIPQKEHPDYNFIGILLGPRGGTQKELEAETGAKIAIRGKGSTKDGRGSRQKEGDDDELHVLITADTETQMRAAIKRVEELLVPRDEGQNEHKRQQLRRLAELNGTLRERNPDMIRAQFRDQFDPAGLRCGTCGDASHATIDCPQAAAVRSSHAPNDMDDAYAQFKALLAPAAAPAVPTPVPYQPAGLPLMNGPAAAEPEPWFGTADTIAPLLAPTQPPNHQDALPPWLQGVGLPPVPTLPPPTSAPPDATDPLGEELPPWMT
jgi:splicing factor 1